MIPRVAKRLWMGAVPAVRPAHAASHACRPSLLRVDGPASLLCPRCCPGVFSSRVARFRRLPLASTIRCAFPPAEKSTPLAVATPASSVSSKVTGA